MVGGWGGLLGELALVGILLLIVKVPVEVVARYEISFFI